MKRDLKHYIPFREFFQYPHEHFLTSILDAQAAIHKRDPEVGCKLREFCDYVRSKSRNELEERYIRTFDVNAICFLDIGYVLFGEDYKRGSFLVGLIREHARAKNQCGAELPDHITNILSLLPKMKDEETLEELAALAVMPALKMMLGGFKEGGNIYRIVIQGLYDVMRSDFADVKYSDTLTTPFMKTGQNILCAGCQ